ncbi:MAG: heavy metal translocating P-type ATPase, partial [Gemmobacter sp.]|nr:heavy metal translocating P-type ATPase [Gemmobacter sp.]
MTDHATIEIDGMHCAACVGRVERILARVPGVGEASVNLATNTARLTGGADLGVVASALTKAGYGLRQATTTLTIDGMTCASCVGRVERALGAVPGIQSATVNLANQTAMMTHVASPEVLASAIAAVARAGYHAEPQTADPIDRAALESATQRNRFWVALALTLPVFVLEMGGHLIPAFHHWIMATIGMQASWTLQFVLVTLVLIGPGRQFLTRGVPALVRLSPDMNSLVALGTVSAWTYSTVALIAPQVLPAAAVAVYFEAAAVIVTLILMGRWMEARARGQTGAAIRRLVGLQPASALVETTTGAEDRPTASLRPGDILRIRPGERIATDSVVLTGTSYVDESMITGEPVPVAKSEGTPVTGGTINGTGALRVEVTRTGPDTTLAQIVRLVAEAQGGKLPIQALVDRVTMWFVPAVMGVAVLTVLVWLVFGPDPVLTHALVAGVSVLIVACPCAMGLATPTSIMVGTGRGAEMGV